jgi:dihydrofolate reductase
VYVTYYVAVSVDGYIATADGGIDWLKPFESTGEDYGYHEFYRSIDAAVMGSRTYEQCLGFAEWPYPGKPCWVFSRRAFANARSDVIITAENPAGVLRQLRARGLMRIWLAGGGELAASMRKSRLIDEYIVSVIPVILGGGIGLFAYGSTKENLRMFECKTYPNGVTQLRYRAASAST